jgi:type III secretory pathway component EscU
VAEAAALQPQLAVRAHQAKAITAAVEMPQRAVAAVRRRLAQTSRPPLAAKAGTEQLLLLQVLPLLVPVVAVVAVAILLWLLAVTGVLVAAAKVTAQLPQDPVR